MLRPLRSIYHFHSFSPPQTVISRVGGGQLCLCRHYSHSQADTETLSTRTSQLITGICRGDRAALGKSNIFSKCGEIFSPSEIFLTSEIFSARGITLIESSERRSQVQARLLVNKLLTQNRTKAAQSFRFKLDKYCSIRSE